jgi:glucose-6-phosphate-specific signal transduction histidine kinase
MWLNSEEEYLMQIRQWLAKFADGNHGTVAVIVNEFCERYEHVARRVLLWKSLFSSLEAEEIVSLIWFREMNPVEIFVLTPEHAFEYAFGWNGGCADDDPCPHMKDDEM